MFGMMAQAPTTFEAKEGPPWDHLNDSFIYGDGGNSTSFQHGAQQKIPINAWC